MTKPHIKFSFTMGFIVTSYVTFTLVAVNVGFGRQFLFLWLRSWAIAFVLVSLSILYLAPIVRKMLKIN
ncbi:MAG: DUF2798 domain-containing protein [Saprospiraceae bacterium]|nr:DUF2798 domain-containing protein [Saprospiraceae bacterium]